MAEFFIGGLVVEGVFERVRSEKRGDESWFRLLDAVREGFAEPLPPGSSSAAATSEPVLGRLVEAYARRAPGLPPDGVRERVLLGVDRIVFQDGRPDRIFPYSRDPEADSPRAVVLDPRVRFGRPTVAGRGVPTDALLERFRAGDSSAELAADYDIRPDEVDEALRYETRSPRLPRVPFPGW